VFRRGRTRQVLALTLTAAVAVGATLWSGVGAQAAPPAAAPSSAPKPGSVIPDRYIVQFRPGTPGVDTLARSLTASARGELHFVYETALQGFAATLPAGAVDGLRRNPNVLRIEPDTMFTASDTQTGATWGIDRIDQRNLPLDGSYTDFNEGVGVRAYVIDTGIRGTHSEFTGRMGAGYTAISDGNGTNDCNGHGTHVAGTVGGSVYGVADKVTLHPVRVLSCTGSGTNSGVIAGINWVAANAVKPAVANMSLGGGASSTLDSAVANLVSSGVVVVVAAGNDNLNACNYSPARVASAITVGATTSTDARASYSNFGSCLDLFAPGSSIRSAWYTGDTATNTISGTSMASPHVAGVAALLLSANPSATPADIRTAMIGNATPSKVTSAGTGSPNLLLHNSVGTPPSTTTTTTASTTTTTTGSTTTTSTPSTTTTTSTPSTTTTTTAPPPSPGNVVRNPGFESGRVSWTESSRLGYVLIDPSFPRSGTYGAWLGGANSETSTVSQSVVVPAGGRLTYWWYATSSDLNGYDWMYVRLTVNGKTTNIRSRTTDVKGAWYQDTIDLSAHAGKTVTIAFRVTTDSSYTSSFYVDDVSIAP